MVDEKKCYLFGRNSQLNDFCIDHSSCSRVHAALVYHKHLNRAFLVDLGSSKWWQNSIVLDSWGYFQLTGRLLERSVWKATSPLSCQSTLPFTLEHRQEPMSSGMSLKGLVIRLDLWLKDSCRERPHTGARGLLDDLENTMDSKNRDLLGLPETEMELDNLTEFNTAQNRRITMLVLPQEADKMKGKRKIRVRSILFKALAVY